jgi:hypothetical protein
MVTDRFLLSLEYVGLPSPFEEETFRMLTEVVGAYLYPEDEDAFDEAA